MTLFFGNKPTIPRNKPSIKECKCSVKRYVYIRQFRHTIIERRPAFITFCWQTGSITSCNVLHRWSRLSAILSRSNSNVLSLKSVAVTNAMVFKIIALLVDNKKPYITVYVVQCIINWKVESRCNFIQCLPSLPAIPFLHNLRAFACDWYLLGIYILLVHPCYVYSVRTQSNCRLHFFGPSNHFTVKWYEIMSTLHDFWPITSLVYHPAKHIYINRTHRETINCVAVLLFLISWQFSLYFLMFPKANKMNRRKFS